MTDRSDPSFPEQLPERHRADDSGPSGEPADASALDAARELDRRLGRLVDRLANDCMLTDAQRLRRRWQAMRGLRAEAKRGDVQPLTDALLRFDDDLHRARQRRTARVQSIPAIRYPADLPVAARRDEIRAAIRSNQVVVLCGDTGSGKSTQLPKICLEAGRGVAGAIAHTQPRRIAARSVAARVAEELEVTLGGIVGVKTRFDDRTGPNTLLSVMTDGILLAETRNDRELLAYDTIIVDEAHERGLNIDFLLGYLQRLLQRRRDLHLVITSATIDPARFSQHFHDAPMIMVEGRTYPIETRYRPLVTDSETENDVDEEEPVLLDAILNAVDEIDENPRDASVRGGRSDARRDILVFFSGEREIREAAEALRGRQTDSEILPLYARLSAEEQDRVFRPSAKRRIVLATNVAETSITVPGIDAVIDPGLARISRYSPRGRVQRLPIEPVSQASANQRRGRCGRTAPGLCIRLYSEEDFAGRAAFTPPEVLRTNLASVILQMAALGLGRPEHFPFLDPPPQRMILAGYETLVELGAVTTRHELTALGRRMALLPVDPRIARVILASIDERCVEEVLVIAAALSVQDPRDRPADKAQAADFAQLLFRDERSDFLGFIKLWKAWKAKSAELGSSALRRWCREHFLSWLRMREWNDVHRQLRDLVVDRIAPRARGDAKFDPVLADEPDTNAVHRALLAGFVGSVGVKGETNEYRAASGGEFFLHPSSVLSKKLPPWVMAAEIVETSRRFGRLCAKIQPDWIERVAPHLVQKTHSEPHWLRDSGQVAAWERVALGSVTVVPKRRVPFGPVDAVAARDIFIQSALVEGEMRTQGTFLQHNANVRAAIELLQAKGRHGDLLVESEARFAFYDARIPATIHSQPSFEKWRREAEIKDPQVLAMRMEDLIRLGAEAPDASRFPDVLVVEGMGLALSYCHAPGEAEDGVTVRVPVTAANRVDPERLEWLVPGLLEEKIQALLRALPKRLRVRFQPATEFAAGAAETLPFGKGSLTGELACHLSELTGVKIDPVDFELEALPAHFRMRVMVTEGDRVLAENRDAKEVLARYRDRAAQDFQTAIASGALGGRHSALLQRGMTDWTCVALPDEVRFVYGGVPLVGYPCLVDEGATVGLRVLERHDEAVDSHRRGVRRLIALRSKSAFEHHVEFLPSLERLALEFAPLGTASLLKRSLVDLAIELGFLQQAPAIPREPVAFDALVRAGEDRIFDATSQAGQIAEPLLRAFHESARALDGHHPPTWSDAIASMRSELKRMVPPNVLTATPVARLRHLPRYVSALRVRLRRLAGNVERDARLQAELDEWTSRLADVPPNAPPDLVERFRLLLEEFRVQLFASELRTAVPVSPERLAEAWEKLRER
ncbi:MAG: ATP-dependent RNA helicase HrpA [Phycisphaerae bacterium]|mgnify:CR=1 FL=1|nr:ATP-dependent RNA helicase HrpA [Phycisphaerae bacterium]